MPIDPDFAREERIKRLRVLVRSGTDQMLVLHDAVPAYERLSSSGEHRMPAVLKAEALMERLPPDVQREQAIRLGYMVAERNHRTFTKIYKWLKLADNSSYRDLSDARFAEYDRLPRLHELTIDNSASDTVEAQIERLTESIEARVQIFNQQLVEDGEYEDLTPALRDAPGGWPHLRSRSVMTDAALDGYLARMRKRRTKAEISDSIGAAKELTEATMKALVEKHGAVTSSGTPDLPDYWKALKPHIADVSVDKALGSTDGALIKLVSSQVATIQNLGELRNRVGSGHGRATHPAGLQPAHALLAVDLAHTLTRFLAT